MAEHDAAPDGEPCEGAVDVDGPTDGDSVGATWSSPVRLAAVVGLVTVVATGALVGFLGYRAIQSQREADRDRLFLEVARQGAVNVTTIDWQDADNDIQRILDSATGTFHDDFSRRSQPFVAEVKQAQSTSVGTVTEAGLESESGDRAQVLVAVSVTTTAAGAVEDRPRAWRMRIDVQRVGNEAKVSDVQFVP